MSNYDTITIVQSIGRLIIILAVCCNHISICQSDINTSLEYVTVNDLEQSFNLVMTDDSDFHKTPGLKTKIPHSQPTFCSIFYG